MSGSNQGTAVQAELFRTEAAGAATGPKADPALQCPTRVDGETPLIQHRLTQGQCQSKQRGLYHKCFTCSNANGR